MNDDLKKCGEVIIIMIIQKIETEIQNKNKLIMGSKIGDLPDELGKYIQDFIRPNMWKVKFKDVVEEINDINNMSGFMLDAEIPSYVKHNVEWNIGLQLCKKIWNNYYYEWMISTVNYRNHYNCGIWRMINNGIQTHQDSLFGDIFQEAEDNINYEGDVWIEIYWQKKIYYDWLLNINSIHHRI